MTIEWTPLAEYKAESGPVSAPWLPVCDDFRGKTYLKVVSKGRWILPSAAGIDCNADGGVTPAAPASPLIAAAPLGALIGKVGGSTASFVAPSIPAPALPGAPMPTPPFLDQAFVLGAQCVFAVPAGAVGPLLFGFNCLVRPVELKQLTITVYGATPV